MEQVREPYGIRVAAGVAQSITEAHASRLTEADLTPAQRRAPERLTRIAEIDGSMIPVVQMGMPDGKGSMADRRQTRKEFWKEAKLSRVRRSDEVTPVFAVTLGDAAAAGAEPETVPAEQAPVCAAYRYRANRPGPFHYQAAIRAGLPIGSGEVERAHRDIIQKRLKLPGDFRLHPERGSRLTEAAAITDTKERAFAEQRRKRMRVFQIQDDWGMANLKIATRPQPRPGAGQVLLRMRASSLNYRDLVVPERGYGSFTGTLPLIPVSDGVGEVVEVGSDVTRVAVGDRVCPIFFQGWIAGDPDLARLKPSLGGPIDGTMAEFMCLPEDGVVKAPAYLSDVEAATLPCAALTAWSALMTSGAVKAGERVLVQGSGGVALFALLFAKLAGAHVTVISSSDEKIERLKTLGADATINYRTTPDWSKPARELTGGRGFDHIVELGGEKTLPQSLRCIRPGGTLSMIGVLSGSSLSTPLGLIITRQVRLQGISVGHRDGFEAMIRALEQHRVPVIVDRVFAFEELKEALIYLRSGAQFGKIGIQH